VSACLLLLPALVTGPALGAVVRPIPGTSCPAFPADNAWHADVSRLPVHPRSAQWLGSMSPTRLLHPDFGGPYGIPVTTVTSAHPRVPVTFEYADESDPGPYPLGADTRVEGGQSDSGDRHTVVVDRDACRLYETWATAHTGTSWSAGSGAIWDLRSNALRPRGWTSADAAGLPILPGLLRYDEVVAGVVDHAVRFTTNVTDRSYVWPARHSAGSVSDASYPPMGARFRLKASYDVAAHSAPAQVVLRGMQRYGMVLADNGSPWFFQGATDARWPDALLDDLKTVPASAFEAVDLSSLQGGSDSGQVRVRCSAVGPWRVHC
jgi:hypothetical protein